MIPKFLTAKNLTARHAFFTRQGGVSEGVYASLNGGTGSGDAPERVAQNRARMAKVLDVTPERFLVPFQIHSADCLIVDAPFSERPRCDGLATAAKNLALGATGADCGMMLFSAPGVIGACHAGWKGALSGIIEATVAAMERLGAERKHIAAALGPCIGPKSYEVSGDFRQNFLTQSAAFEMYFSPSERKNHFMFDLPGFLTMRAEEAQVGAFKNLQRDVYAEEDLFFSYRRMTHRGEADYGRLVSAIVLD